MPEATNDPFTTLQNFEETFYQSGYETGVADGSRAGRIEGRVFGLEKGFEKFLELGKLAGRSEVWKIRMDERNANLPADVKLQQNQRLRKHVETFHALVEPATFDMRNNEEAVDDFDDRFKRGNAKAKVIERIVGEAELDESASEDSARKTDRNAGVRTTRQQAQEKNMEDFGVAPRPSRTNP